MKICLFGTPGVNGLRLGTHNLKDPRLDQAHKLVDAKKKTHVQVELVGEDGLTDADAILVPREHRADLILKDLELVETRLSRNPPALEQAALTSLQATLENEQFVSAANLDEEEHRAIAIHAWVTRKPVVVADRSEFGHADALLARAYHESGYVSFLTVGGKENRAWKIRKNATAWEAAGAIHSDMQKGFVRAEIISYNDFIQAGGETQAKRAGTLRLETKNYVMQDYDLVSFRFNP